MVTDLFNFISDEKFRASLENDFGELEKCMKAEAWKAVHVLAGSVVETLLIDYLMVTEYEKRSSQKISKLNLYQIIEICKEEQVLSNKAADLAHAIREYRNLIHPEKLRRLEETADENGAIIAQALVKMVIDGISTRRSQQVGLTAEQLVTKIERDPSVTSIFGHLLKNIRESEKRRLLMSMLPKRYIYLKISESQTKEDVQKANILAALEISYRTAWNSSSKETKEDAAKELVRILKEEGAQVVSIYEEVFFRGSDLEYFSSEDQQMFKHHFLSRLTKGFDNDLMKAADGIGVFLNAGDVANFVDSFVRAMAYDIDIDNDKAKKSFFAEFDKMSEKVREEVEKRLKDWIYTFQQSQQEFGLKIAEKLKEEADSRIGFVFLPDYPEETEIMDEPDFPEEPDYLDL